MADEISLTLAALELVGGRLVSSENSIKLSEECDVLLGAGPLDTLILDLEKLCASTLALVIVNGNTRGRGVTKGWSRRYLSHESVGGATDWTGTVMARAWTVPPVPPSVRRNLSHVLDHSDRPQECPKVRDFAHLNPNKLLPLGVPLLDVVFPSHCCRTGWGRRPLNDKEIGGAMDLPLWFSTSPLFDAWSQRHALCKAMPLKLFQTILNGLFRSIDPVAEVIGREASPDLSDLPGLLEIPDEFWIPELNTFLPGSWVDAGEVSAKAAKADNAKIHTGLWDHRITLVLSDFADEDVEYLRPGFYQVWCQKLTGCFNRFMLATHGLGWQERLFKLRRLRRLGANAMGSHRGGSEYFVFQEDDFTGLFGEDSNETALTELLEDGDMGSVALSKGLNGSWWEWSRGSALFFWRWHFTQRKDARDGMEIFVRDDLPQKMSKGRSTNQDKVAAVGEKLNKVYERGYILKGPVDSTIDFFDVEKGDDIRMVYNGTSCGLNHSLFAPGFYLPKAATAARPLMNYSWMADSDMGEMFLNFPMDKAVRSRAGIDVTQMRHAMPNLPPTGEGRHSRVLLRWERLFMGMKPSPYNAVRYYYWAEEMARGDPKDPKNPLHYTEVRLNLPGMPNYDPTHPHVYKWNGAVERVAGDVVTFVDDTRVCGYSKENAWQVVRRVASILQYLGIQDAPRKRRPPSQSPGAWAGSLQSVEDKTVGISVTQAKWVKGQVIIRALVKECLQSLNPSLLHKQLEKDRGFLVHLGMTFECIVPFLRGIHMTLDQWRVGRDADGWARSDKEHREWVRHFYHTYRGQEDVIYELINAGAPLMVEPVTRMLDDLVCLEKIFEPEFPPRIILRATFIFLIIYGFGDASGKGFGSTFAQGSDISYRIGTWGEDESNESSNWREFTNVVESLEDEAESGRLTNTVVYFFTDNSTVESAIYRGTSKSRKLLGLVIRVKVLEAKYSIQLHVCHVAGTRMIAEGGDGVSRGLLNEGVMAGEDILSFIPLHLSAIERSPTLVDWLKTWVGQKLEVLTPMDWYEKGHDIRGWTHPQGRDLFPRQILRKGVYGWFPPPAAADVALEQMRIARIKRQDSTHVFVVPRLLTPRWLKQMFKACDVVLVVPPGKPGWPGEMFEPLLIGICFPFLRFKPWQLRSTPKMFYVARDLRRLFKIDGVDAGPFLRKFWKDCHRMRALPQDVVSRMLFFLPDSNLSHSSERGGGNRPDGDRRRRRPDELGVAKKDKKQRCI